jgi:hypothetical protein
MGEVIGAEIAVGTNGGVVMRHSVVGDQMNMRIHPRMLQTGLCISDLRR